MEKGRYRTNWTFADRSAPAEAVFKMIEQAGSQMGPVANKENFLRYTTFLFLTGARRIEPFLKPPTIERFEEDGHTFFKVTKANAKHFQGNQMRCKECLAVFPNRKSMRSHQQATGHLGAMYTAERKVVSTIILAEDGDRFELALWSFLLQGRERLTIDFSDLLPKKARLALAEPINIKLLESGCTSLSRRFARTFRASLNDGKAIHENSSVVPHQLRHLRAYSLLVTNGWPRPLAMKVIGWDTGAMLDRYADIASALGTKELMAQYRSLLAGRK